MHESKCAAAAPPRTRAQYYHEVAHPDLASHNGRNREQGRQARCDKFAHRKVLASVLRRRRSGCRAAGSTPPRSSEDRRRDISAARHRRGAQRRERARASPPPARLRRCGDVARRAEAVRHGEGGRAASAQQHLLRRDACLRGEPFTNLDQNPPRPSAAGARLLNSGTSSAQAAQEAAASTSAGTARAPRRRRGMQQAWRRRRRASPAQSGASWVRESGRSILPHRRRERIRPPRRTPRRCRACRRPPPHENRARQAANATRARLAPPPHPTIPRQVLPDGECSSRCE